MRLVDHRISTEKEAVAMIRLVEAAATMTKVRVLTTGGGSCCGNFLAQRLHRVSVAGWSSVAGDDATDLRDQHTVFTSLEMFETQEPECVDWGNFIHEAADRNKICHWREVQSDLEECVSVCDIQVVQVDCGLHGKKIPVLRLLDAVMAAGYHLVDRSVCHSPDDPLQVVRTRFGPP